MLDDYKYSVGRLVVYKHLDPKLPRQSYGHYGHEKTIGEIVSVDMAPKPDPHWVYTIRNVRNQETSRVEEGHIKFATTVGRSIKRPISGTPERKVEDGALAEMIAKALSNPDRANLLRSTLREILYKEEMAAKVSREGANLPIYVGTMCACGGICARRPRACTITTPKLSVWKPADIAGIENPNSKPGSRGCSAL